MLVMKEEKAAVNDPNGVLIMLPTHEGGEGDGEEEGWEGFSSEATFWSEFSS